MKQSDAETFLHRWGDLHDAVIEVVVFDHPQATVRVQLRAQDGNADWAWRKLLLTVEDVTEFSYRQPQNHGIEVIFEAGLLWVDAIVLLALHSPFEQDAVTYRSSDAYFGGARLRWETLSP